MGKRKYTRYRLEDGNGLKGNQTLVSSLSLIIGKGGAPSEVTSIWNSSIRIPENHLAQSKSHQQNMKEGKLEAHSG